MITTHTLSNGIRLIHKAGEGVVSCCGLVVHAGSRHEQPDELGLAHFTEHLLFKGTQKRRSHHILNRMERVGGELNAYTTKEETFVYSLFLKEDFGRALELLSDLFFRSSFPESEIAKERVVVLDEINSYEDSPSELIFDDFDQLIFPDHPLGQRILGHPESLETFNSDRVRAFHARAYHPERVVFYSQSALPFKQVLRLAERYLGSVKTSSQWEAFGEEKPNPAIAQRSTISKDTHQAHVMLGNAAYSFFDSDRLGLYFLNNILGGPGMNSRLNIALRERSGLVYGVESSVTSFTDSGLFSIYFGTDPDQVDRCLDLVEKELKRLRNKPLSDATLRSARKQLYGQLRISSENKESQTLSMGKSMLYFNTFEPLDQVFHKIEAFQAKQLMEIAERIFDPRTMSLLVYK